MLVVLVVLAGLVLLGRAAAPSWDPPPLPAELAYPPLPPLAEPAEPAAGGFRRVDASVPTTGGPLRAAVFAPERPGRHPAVAFVHGAGAGRLEAFAGQAEYLARHGVVVLVYDKRTAGYSPLRRDYRELAEDAIAAAAVLRGRTDVDPGRVGLWGTSEGGWVVPLAAAADAAVAFVILMNAPAMSPLAQSTWSLDAALRRAGAPADLRRAAIRAFDLGGSGGSGYVRYDPGPALAAVRQPALILQGTGDHAIPPVESPRRLVAALPPGRTTVRFFDGADHGMLVHGQLAPSYLATMAAWILGLPQLPRPAVAGAAPRQEHLSATVPPPWYGGLPALLVALASVLAGYLLAPLTSGVSAVRNTRVGRFGTWWRPKRSSAGGRPFRREGVRGRPFRREGVWRWPFRREGVRGRPFRRGEAWASHASQGERWDAQPPGEAGAGAAGGAEAGQMRRRLRWLTAAGVVTMLIMNAALGTAIGLAAADAGSAVPATVLWYGARAVAAGTTVLLVATAFAMVAARRAGWRPRGVQRARAGGVLAATSVVVLVAAYWLA